MTSYITTTKQMATPPQRYQQGLFYIPRESSREYNRVEEFRAPSASLGGRNNNYGMGNGGLYSKQMDKAKTELSNFRDKFNQWKKLYDKEIGKTKADLANLTPRLIGLGLASKIHNLSSVTTSRLSTPNTKTPPGCATPMSNYSTPGPATSGYNTPFANTPRSATPGSATPILKCDSSSSIQTLKRLPSNCDTGSVTALSNQHQ